MVWYWIKVLLNLRFESWLRSFLKNGGRFSSFKKQYAHKRWWRPHSCNYIWGWKLTKFIKTKAFWTRRLNGWIRILIVRYVRGRTWNMYWPFSRLWYQNKWQITFKNIMSYKAWSDKWWSTELGCTWWS